MRAFFTTKRLLPFLLFLFFAADVFSQAEVINAAGMYWRLRGNSSTDTATHFLGTLDAAYLTFRTNNIRRMTIDTGGRVGIGTINPSLSGMLEVTNTNSGFSTNPTIITTNYGNPNEFWFRRAQGSISAPTILGSAGSIGRIDARGYDGANYINATRIEMLADSSTSSNNMAGRIIFSTNPANSTATPVERMRINRNGLVGINTTTPAARLDINGDLAVRQATLTLVNGSNDNVAVSPFPNGSSYYRITGPTAAFSITGLTAGADGRIVILQNTTTQTLTVKDQTVSSVSNRIMTGGGDLTVGDSGTVTLIYSTVDNRWQVQSFTNGTLANTAGGTSWQLLGNSGTTAGTNFVGTTDAQDLVLKRFNVEGLRMTTGGALWATGNTGTGVTPTAGGGTRMMWIPAKGAFRAGDVTGTQWDDANIGSYSAVFGRNNQATGTHTLVSGGGNSAAGNYSVVFNNTASSTAAATTSMAGGFQSQTQANLSIAIGWADTAKGVASVALGGFSNEAQADNSFSTGNNNLSSGTQAATFGSGNTASGTNSFATGNNNNVSGQNSLVTGNGNTVTATHAFVSGNGNNAAGNYSAVFNNTASSTAAATTSMAGGFQSQTQANLSIAIGWADTAKGVASVAIGGFSNEAQGVNSFSTGNNNLSSGAQAVTFGSNNAVTGANSLSTGESNTTTAIRSIVAGLSNRVEGENNLVSGVFNYTAPGFGHSIAVGYQDTINASSSAAFGFLNKLTAFTTFAAGDRNMVTGQTSTAFGYQNVASGTNSFVTGQQDTTVGNLSSAFGTGNRAASFNEMAIGMYGTQYTAAATSAHNTTDRIFNVGIGTAANARADAFTILKGGNVRVRGLATGGTFITAPSATTDKIMYADANGDLRAMTGGSTGYVLTYTTSGPAWDSATATAWGLTGNSGTTAGTHFAGTTDNQDFVLKRNNVEAFRLTTGGALLATGNTVSGITPASGAGTRAMWVPQKQAFRAGLVTGAEWDAANIGAGSAAFGTNNIAAAPNSFSTGDGNVINALASHSVVMGLDNTVNVGSSGNVVLGSNNTVTPNNSVGGAVAIGVANTVTGNHASAIGSSNEVYGDVAFATGLINDEFGDFGFISGRINTVRGDYGFAHGQYLTSRQQGTVIFGQYNDTTLGGNNPATWVDADPLFVLGDGTSLTARSNALVVLKNAKTGINNITPNTLLDVKGDLALREKALTLANGTNSNIAVDTNTFFRITGPTAAFTVTGFSGGVDGKLLTLFNNTSQTLTVDAMNVSAAANQILTGGGDLIIADSGTVSFQYNSTIAKWVLTGFANGNFANSNEWSITGNSGTSSNTNFLGTTDNVALVLKTNNQQSGRLDPLYSSAFYGYWAGRDNGTATQNVAVGTNASLLNSVGNRNTAVGTLSLENNVGSGNTAIGYAALQANTTAGNSTAVGFEALTSNIDGVGNTALGYRTLHSANTTTADNNTAIGHDALFTLSSGTDNVSIGKDAMRLSNSNYNVAVGSEAMDAHTSGNWNAAVGFASLGAATNSSHNVAIGAHALASVTTVGQQIAIGSNALRNSTTGTLNVAVGDSAMFYNNGGSNNASFGTKALHNNTSGSANTAMGYHALYSNVSGTNLVAIGDSALYSQNGGAGRNTAVGSNSLWQNTTGQQNTAVGHLSLAGNTTGWNNAAVGYLALQKYSGDNNTAVGAHSLRENLSGSFNTALGMFSLTNNTGASNTASGYSALLANTAGTNNTAIGANAGNVNTIGTHNSFFGNNANASANSLTNATAIGSTALVGQSNTIVLGSINGVNGATSSVRVGIGTTTPATKLTMYDPDNVNVTLRIASVSTAYEPAVELMRTGAGGEWKIRTNTTGQLAFSRSPDDFATNVDYYEMTATSYRPAIDGNNSLGEAGARWTTVFATNGTINTSDARDKENIQPLTYGISEVMKLKPITYTWKENPQWGKKIGFIAQEVQPVLKEVVQQGNLKPKTDTTDPETQTTESDKLGIYYSDIIPVTVKAIQEQQLMFDAMKQENESLKNRLEVLQKRIEELEKK